MGITGKEMVIWIAVVFAFSTLAPPLVSAADSEKQDYKLEDYVYDFWKSDHYNDINYETYKHFHFFNVTNAEKILSKGSRPIVEEVGPYVFREYQRKENIVYADDKSVIRYDLHTRYEHNPGIGKSLDDIVTVLNMPLLNFSYWTQGSLEGSTQRGVNQLMAQYNVQVFIKKTVRELLFQGYKDDMFVAIENRYVKNILPNKEGMFGYLYGQTSTVEPKIAVNTGIKKSDDQIFDYEEWDGESKLSDWTGDRCNEIRGTDGRMFKPNVNKESKLAIFSPELCRSVDFVYKEEKHYQTHDTFIFIPANTTFSSPSRTPENECYCDKAKPVWVEQCLDSGLLDVSKCKDAPIIASFPHFYGGEERFMDAISGINPITSKHSSAFYIDPKTGVVLRSHWLVQYNLAMRPFSHIEAMRYLPARVLPVYWTNRFSYLGLAKFRKFESDYDFHHRDSAHAITGIGFAGLLLLSTLLLAI